MDFLNDIEVIAGCIGLYTYHIQQDKQTYLESSRFFANHSVLPEELQEQQVYCFIMGVIPLFLLMPYVVIRVISLIAELDEEETIDNQFVLR